MKACAIQTTCQSHQMRPQLSRVTCGYLEIIGSCAAIAAVLLAGCWLWTRRKRTPQASLKTSRPKPSRAPAKPARIDRNRSPLGQEFDKLATMISDANDRAGHISETQSAAALKLDSAEMAVNRLVAEIESVMTVPKTAPPVQLPQVAQSATSAKPRPNLAA